jgi:hypothetical protein
MKDAVGFLRMEKQEVCRFDFGLAENTSSGRDGPCCEAVYRDFSATPAYGGSMQESRACNGLLFWHRHHVDAR